MWETCLSTVQMVKKHLFKLHHRPYVNRQANPLNWWESDSAEPRRGWSPGSVIHCVAPSRHSANNSHPLPQLWTKVTSMSSLWGAVETPHLRETKHRQTRDAQNSPSFSVTLAQFHVRGSFKKTGGTGLFYLWNKLCSSGWPWTHSYPPASASQVLGLKMFTTMPSFLNKAKRVGRCSEESWTQAKNSHLRINNKSINILWGENKELTMHQQPLRQTATSPMVGWVRTTPTGHVEYLVPNGGTVWRGLEGLAIIGGEL